MNTATLLAPTDAVTAATLTRRLQPLCYTPVTEWRRACAMAALVRAVSALVDVANAADAADAAQVGGQ